MRWAATTIATLRPSVGDLADVEYLVKTPPRSMRAACDACCTQSGNATQTPRCREGEHTAAKNSLQLFVLVR